MSDFLQRLADLKILVVGDLILDHYVWGEVDRISPEAPVPVVHAIRDTWAAGGAANVALNLAGLGVRTTVLGHVGQDDAGRRLRAILDQNQVSFHDACGGCNPAAPTIVKTRVIARTQQLCRIDREADIKAYRLAPDNIEAWVPDAIEGCDAVILSDYAKGVVGQAVVDAFSGYCRDGGVLLAMDPKPARKLDLRGLGLLTPNRAEAFELAGIDPKEIDDPVVKACRAIHQRFQPDRLVITLGADGMAVSTNGDVEHVLPTEAREVFDVSGAGDTVIAALTAAIAAGASEFDAARFANRAAGIVVGQMGTVPISRTELEGS